MNPQCLSAAQIVQGLFRLLLEMNHEVRGEARQESVDQVRSLEICPRLNLNFRLCILQSVGSQLGSRFLFPIPTGDCVWAPGENPCHGLFTLLAGEID